MGWMEVVQRGKLQTYTKSRDTDRYEWWNHFLSRSRSVKRQEVEISHPKTNFATIHRRNICNNNNTRGNCRTELSLVSISLLSHFFAHFLLGAKGWKKGRKADTVTSVGRSVGRRRRGSDK